MAFRSLYGLYAERVYNTALSYVKNKSDAEEITQDVFLNVYKHAGKYRGEASLSTWIYRITVNTSLNRLKRKKKWTFLQISEQQEMAHFDHPGVLLEQKEYARWLFRLIDGLADNQKTAIILSYVEQLPRKEVAQIMDTTVKSVESLLQRAKKNMRKKMEEIQSERGKIE